MRLSICQASYNEARQLDGTCTTNIVHNNYKWYSLRLNLIATHTNKG